VSGAARDEMASKWSEDVEVNLLLRNLRVELG
jgi:hypothetical protein